MIYINIAHPNRKIKALRAGIYLGEGNGLFTTKPTGLQITPPEGITARVSGGGFYTWDRVSMPDFEDYLVGQVIEGGV
jgi:hypothetical protein